MFHEYREKITELKQKDHHFKKLFDKHNFLDEEISELEKHYANEVEVKNKKKEKLKLKEEILEILKKN